MNWRGLSDVPVYEKLQADAEKPFDLSAAGALEHNGRVEKYVCETEYFKLFYGTQRIDDSVILHLQELAEDCCLVDQFVAMKKGAVLNNIKGYESEERQVLHTASRDLFTDKPAEPNSTAQSKKEMQKLQDFLIEVDNGKLLGATGKKFDTIIQVGIGGSDLGPRAIFEALRSNCKDGKKVFFISNVDPDDAASVLKNVNLETSLINMVSKSGTTLETLTNETLVRDALANKGLDPAKHCVAVTGEGSPMDNPENYLRSFYMFDYIGGRYSATSMVGAVTLAFSLGFDQLTDFLKGASDMDMVAEKKSLSDNLPLLLAMLGIWNHNFLGYPTLAVLPYCQALHRFPAHLQQCDMESNGKSVTRDGEAVQLKSGPIVWGEPGTNGQHAFYQLLHQGTEVVPIEFIGFLESQYQEDLDVQGTTSQQKLVANLFAQSVAFATGKKSDNPNKNFQGNRPNSMLIGKRLTPQVMGALLALYEAKIAFQGFAWNINSFDQEGVQLGKVLAGRFLDLMKGSEGEPKGVENLLLKTVQKAVL